MFQAWARREWPTRAQWYCAWTARMGSSTTGGTCRSKPGSSSRTSPSGAKLASLKDGLCFDDRALPVTSGPIYQPCCRSAGRIVFSRVNFVCWLFFGVRTTPVLPQWHVKDPGHSAKSAGGRLHLNTHTPLTQRSRSGLTMPLSGHSTGAYQETSSHAARQGTLDHGRLSLLSHCGLILA